MTSARAAGRTSSCRAVVSPDLATVLRGNYEGGQQLIATVLRLSQQYGEAPADLDPDQEATALLAMIDGLTAHVLIGRCSADTAHRVITTYLARLFRNGLTPATGPEDAVA
jgi:hypothetical protein